MGEHIVRPAQQGDHGALGRLVATSASRQGRPRYGRMSAAAALTALATVAFSLLLVPARADAGPASAGVAAAATAGPESTPFDSMAGFTFEPLAPRVGRMIDDGAGHDADELPPSGKWIWKLTLGADGSIWVLGEDGLLQLGTPGLFDNPIGPGALELDIEADGTRWIRNGGVARGDESLIIDVTDEHDPRPTEMTVHPDGGVLVAFQYEDRNELRHLIDDPRARGVLIAPPLYSDAPDWRLISPVITHDGATWVIRQRVWYGEAERLPAELWRTDGTTWEQVVPLGSGTDAEPRRLVLLPDGSLLVDMVASGTPEGTDREVRRDIGAYGDEVWLARLETDGSWTSRSSQDGVVPAAAYLAAADADAAWFSLSRGAGPSGATTDCRGVLEVRGEMVERYLDGICAYSIVVAPDGTVWLAAGRQGFGPEPHPVIYVITPPMDQ